jgi:hypothetical protein
MIDFRSDMNLTGPMFDGRAEKVVKEMADDAEEVISDYAYNQVQDRLSDVLKHPTGRYQSRVRNHQVGSRWQVDDDNVVYGPWLEDGRHRRRTRFRGYQTFRRIFRVVEVNASRIADRVVKQNIGRLM